MRIESNYIQTVEKGVKAGFGKVREELDMQRDSINENTSEIDVVHARIDQIERKIDKILERLDQLSIQQKPVVVDSLTLREQEVFVALYMSNSNISAKDISLQLGISEEMILSHINSIVGKGVPVNKAVTSSGVLYRLEPLFKDLQARQNLISIHDSVLEQFARNY